MVASSTDRCTFATICYLLTQCQEGEGANGFEGREDGEINMQGHEHTSGRPVNEKLETSTHWGHVMSLDAVTTLGVHIIQFVYSSFNILQEWKYSKIFDSNLVKPSNPTLPFCMTQWIPQWWQLRLYSCPFSGIKKGSRLFIDDTTAAHLRTPFITFFTSTITLSVIFLQFGAIIKQRLVNILRPGWTWKKLSTCSLGASSCIVGYVYFPIMS